MYIDIAKKLFGAVDIDFRMNKDFHAQITDFVLIKSSYPLYEMKCDDFLDYWSSDITKINYSDEKSNDVCVYQNLQGGVTEYTDPTKCNFGIRPSIDYNFIICNGTLISEENVYRTGYKSEGLYSIYQYGEYPQSLADFDALEELERLYKTGELVNTGKSYAYLSDPVNNPENYSYDEEYIYEGKKYIRAKITNKEEYLKNYLRFFIQEDDYIWIAVEPINWIVDITNKQTMTDKVLAGPMQYNNEPKKGTENTYVGNYLKNHFSKEIDGNFKYDFDITIDDKDRCLVSLNDWLDWSNNNLIHPVIRMFMIDTNGMYLNENVKWEDVSNILYQTKDLSSLSSLLSEEIYTNLFNLYLSINISMDEVLNNTVDIDRLNHLSTTRKYLLVVLLTLIDETDYDLVCDFIENKVGKKYIKLYKKIFEQCSEKKINVEKILK